MFPSFRGNFFLLFFTPQVKPDDDCEADDNKRRAEFVSKLKEIFPIITEQNARP